MPPCAELFIEVEFRSSKTLHECDASHSELVGQRSLIEIGSGTKWPKTEQVSTLQIASNSEDVPYFYAQDFYVRYDDPQEGHDIEVELA